MRRREVRYAKLSSGGAIGGARCSAAFDADDPIVDGRLFLVLPPQEMIGRRIDDGKGDIADLPDFLRRLKGNRLAALQADIEDGRMPVSENLEPLWRASA
jgi:hypothetical protein